VNIQSIVNGLIKKGITTAIETAKNVDTTTAGYKAYGTKYDTPALTVGDQNYYKTGDDGYEGYDKGDLINYVTEKPSSLGGSGSGTSGGSGSLSGSLYGSAASSGTGGYGGFSDYYNSLYGSVANQQNAALQAEIKRQVKALTGQKDDVSQDADDLYRQAFVQNQLSQKKLPQQMAAGGYTGGMADTYATQLALELQNNQVDIGKQKASALADIDAAIAQAKLAGTSQEAQNNAALLSQAISGWDSYNQNQQAQALSQSENERQQAYRAAMTLLAAGVTPSAALLAKAGIGQDDASAYATAVQTQMAPKATAATYAPTYQQPAANETSTGEQQLVDSFNQQVVATGGYASYETVQALLAAGYTEADLKAAGWKGMYQGGR